MHRGLALCGFKQLVAIALVVTSSSNRELSAQEKSSPAALAIYADAANFQNNGAFDLAAEEWDQFLKKFAKDPLASKALHYSGVCNVQLKRYERAVQDFSRLIRDYPKFENLEDAYLNLGWSYFKRADEKQADTYSQAVATLQKMMQTFPDGKLGDQALYFLGESQYGLGKLDEAVSAYNQLVSKYPRSNMRQQGLYALGVAQEEAKTWGEAGATYDLFLKEFASHDLANEVRMRKAESVLQTGNAAAAEQLFASAAAIKDFTSADHALFRQAFSALKQEKHETAARLYVTLTKQFPKSVYFAEAEASAGRSFYRAGKFDESIAWLQKSITGGGSFAPESAHWMCKIHLRNKEPVKVITLCEQVLPRATESPYLVFLELDQADAMYEIPEQRTTAVKRYLNIADNHPKHELAAQSLYNAAFGNLELKQFADAQALAARFHKSYPQDKLVPDVHYLASESKLQAGQLADAESAFRALINSHSAHSELERWQLRLGTALLLQKKYGETSDYLNALAPRFTSKENAAEALFLIGSGRFSEEKFKEAADALTSSIANSKNWRQADECLLLLVRCHHKLGQEGQAVATAERLLKDYPQSRIHDQVYYRRGEMYFASGKYSAAQREYQQLLEKAPSSSLVPYALHGQGWALLKQDQFQPASKLFGELLSKHPDHSLAADAWLARAVSRRKSGDHKGAIADIGSFLKTNPSLERKSSSLFERGLAELGLDDAKSAVHTFTELLRDDPSYTSADQVLYELAWAHKQQNQPEQAIAAFAKIAKLNSKSPYAAEALFHLAEDHYDRKAYKEASQLFARAKQMSPEGDLAEKVAYKLGWAQFQQQDFHSAGTEFRDFIQKFPHSSLRADCLFMAAESLFKQQKYKEALESFQVAAKVKPSSQQMEVLTVLHSGQCASQLKQWDATLQTLTRIDREFPDSAYVAEAAYEQGWAKHNLGRADEAFQDFERSATNSRDHVGARSRFMMGEILFEKKKFDEASKQFQRVMFGFGGDNSLPEVKMWQAKAAHEAARCAEVQIQNFTDPKRKSMLAADARKYYEYLVSKHPQDGLASQAKRRLEEIKKL